MALSNCSWLGELKLENFALELLALEQVKEVWLALAFCIDRDEGASEWLEKDAHWFYHVCNRNLFDRLGFLLVELDVVERDEIVCRQHKVEVIGDYKAHGLNGVGLWELEPHFLGLLLLEEEQCHLDVPHLHGQAGA